MKSVKPSKNYIIRQQNHDMTHFRASHIELVPIEIGKDPPLEQCIFIQPHHRA